MHTVPDAPGSLPLSPPQHEAFCQALVMGSPAALAYREHISAECTTKTSWEAASRLLRDDKVTARLSFLRAAAAKTGLKHFGATVETVLQQHWEIVCTPLAELNEHHPLCQKMKRRRRVVGSGEDAAPWETEEVEASSKSKALDAIATICGYNAAVKTEVSGSLETSTVLPLSKQLNGPATRAAVIRAVLAHPEAREEIREALGSLP